MSPLQLIKKLMNGEFENRKLAFEFYDSKDICFRIFDDDDVSGENEGRIITDDSCAKFVSDLFDELGIRDVPEYDPFYGGWK